MADDNLLVTISGPALSLLLYENRRIHDQVGFLLGEIVKYVSKKITDSDRDVECIKQHINIKCVEPYPISKPFFNTIGQIDEDILKSFLKDNIKKVVGWYHYREADQMQLTFRDRILHSELSTFFSNANKPLLTEENFIICILSSSKSEIGGTHKFKHLLLRSGKRQSSKYIPVPLKINNLGADATRPDGSDYKPIPIDSSCKTDAFDSIYESVKNDLLHKSGVDSVILIQKAAERRLEELILEVTKYDRIISELELELNTLRQSYFHRNFNKIVLDKKIAEMEIENKSSSNLEFKPFDIPEVLNRPKSYAAACSSGKLQSLPSTKLSTSNCIRKDDFEPQKFQEVSRSYKECDSLETNKIFMKQKQRMNQLMSSSTDTKFLNQSPEQEDTNP